MTPLSKVFNLSGRKGRCGEACYCHLSLNKRGIEWYLIVKKLVSMIRKYHSHKLHTNPRHHEEELQDIYSNKTSERQKSKATSSLFLVKMVAKLERIYSNAYQRKDLHRIPTNNERYTKQ